MRSDQVLLTALILQMACSPGVPRRTATPPKVEGPATELRATLDRHCAACHNESAKGVPSLAFSTLDRTMLYRTAVAVAAARMPPAPTPLHDVERRRLVEMLCDAGGPRSACPALVAPAERGPLVVSPAEYLQLVDQALNTHTDKPKGVGDRSLDEYAPGERIVHLDASYLTFSALTATERCPAPQASDAGAFEACARTLIDPKHARVPLDPEGSK